MAQMYPLYFRSVMIRVRRGGMRTEWQIMITFQEVPDMPRIAHQSRKDKSPSLPSPIAPYKREAYLT